MAPCGPLVFGAVAPCNSLAFLRVVQGGGVGSMAPCKFLVPVCAMGSKKGLGVFLMVNFVPARSGVVVKSNVMADCGFPCASIRVTSHVLWSSRLTGLGIQNEFGPISWNIWWGRKLLLILSAKRLTASACLGIVL